MFWAAVECKELKNGGAKQKVRGAPGSPQVGQEDRLRGRDWTEKEWP